jgi:tetratricopeptide (TPR) repeat protein
MAKPKHALTHPRALGLLLALITVLAYLPATRNDFVNYDDGSYVTENPVVQQGWTWQGVKWAFTTFTASNWHPVTWLSHLTDCELFRLNPGGHHFTSIVIHAANVMLLFLLVLRWTQAVWPSAFIAALFAWHPLHVESVAWVSERKDVLSTFFALLTLLAYGRYVQSRGEKPQTIGDSAIGGGTMSIGAGFRSRFYWLALLCFALGLMSKPMVVTLPGIMLLLDYWPLARREIWWRLFLEKMPFLLLVIPVCVATVAAQQGHAMASLHLVPLNYRLGNAAIAYVTYLLKFIYPVHLAVLYPLPQELNWPLAFCCAAVLAGITALVWWSRRRHPCLLVGWLWYLGTLVPVIGLVQVGEQAMADRYLYLPMVGLLLAVVFFIKDLAGPFHLSTRQLGWAAGLTLAACLGLTERQLSYWRNTQTLFAHALAVTGENAVAQINLGDVLEKQQQLDAALKHYEAALRIQPGEAMAYNKIGRVLSMQGKSEAALNYCQTAVKLDPKSPYFLDSLGIVLTELGRLNEATRQFARAIQLDAEYAPAHFQMGRVLLKQGNDVAAVRSLLRAVAIEPDNFQMLIYTARVLAADENPAARDGAEALALARRAARLASRPQFIVYDTLAMASAETGRFDEAVQNEKRAMDLARPQAPAEDLASMEKRLKRYREQQPWRESFRPE